jgi:hypothetical protein
MIHAFVKQIACSTSPGRAFWDRLRAQRSRRRFAGSKQYFENHYKNGGTSGAGSYGRLAAFKAEILNHFILNNHVKTVIEFGCGDGAQLGLVNYHEYIGLDISQYAINLCRLKFNEDTSKIFYPNTPIVVASLPIADLTLSLDVVYHHRGG